MLIPELAPVSRACQAHQPRSHSQAAPPTDKDPGACGDAISDASPTADALLDSPTPKPDMPAVDKKAHRPSIGAAEPPPTSPGKEAKRHVVPYARRVLMDTPARRSAGASTGEGCCACDVRLEQFLRMSKLLDLVREAAGRAAQLGYLHSIQTRAQIVEDAGVKVRR